MATFIISKIKTATDKRREKAESLLNTAAYWCDLALKDSNKAKELYESSLQYCSHAKQCREEAAKLLGFKHADEMDVYIQKHGKL